MGEGESQVERWRKGREKARGGLLQFSIQTSLVPAASSPARPNWLLQEVSPLLPRGFVLAGCNTNFVRGQKQSPSSHKRHWETIWVAMEGTQVPSPQKYHQKAWRRENTGSVMSPSLSSLGLPPQARGASGRTGCWGKPAINQLCLY